MSQEQAEVASTEDLLDMIEGLTRRIIELETGGCAGDYIPQGEDEQRRVWVLSMFCNSEIDIDINLEQMHKATHWLKTGELPRKRKTGTKEDGGKVLQLVK